MEFQANIPIYLQIMDDIKQQIVSGRLKPGDKLASVRDLAMQYGVNPNTVQKSFEQLEQNGLIYSIRGSGWFVGNNIELAKQQIDTLAIKKTKNYFESIILRSGKNE